MDYEKDMRTNDDTRDLKINIHVFNQKDYLVRDREREEEERKRKRLNTLI